MRKPVAAGSHRAEFWGKIHARKEKASEIYIVLRLVLCCTCIEWNLKHPDKEETKFYLKNF